MASPSTPEDWMAVAQRRGADSRAMLGGELSTGPVYMAGYAVECSLKAYLKSQEIDFPAGGPAGHNLAQLWKAARFPLTDLRDTNGAKTFYVDTWTTALRYELAVPSALSPEELVTGAVHLAGWLQTRARRAGWRK